jgi:hypothetical protein
VAQHAFDKRIDSLVPNINRNLMAVGGINLSRRSGNTASRAMAAITPATAIVVEMRICLMRPLTELSVEPNQIRNTRFAINAMNTIRSLMGASLTPRVLSRGWPPG